MTGVRIDVKALCDKYKGPFRLYQDRPALLVALVVQHLGVDAYGFEYAFSPFTTKSSNVIFDIPTFSDVEVTITITSTSGNVKCGSVVLGTYAYIGDVLQYAKADSLNFSEITRDIYGTATLVKRKS